MTWRTKPGASVSHAGSVRFVSEGSGTRVDISLRYDPPNGVIAHEVAALMDSDAAGARIEQDLAEYKRAVEGGRLAA
jgi:uncharacterized membrane protein